MNRIWHIIKKDFSHNRLVIFLWAVSIISLALCTTDFARGTWMTHEFLLVCIFAVYTLPLGIIAFIIHEDNMVDSEGFMRTRPISPQCLLSAKLGLVLTLFVVVPSLLVLVHSIIQPGPSWAPKMGTAGLGLACGVLAASAVAACCKNLSRYCVALVAGLFCYAVLRVLFVSLIEATPFGLRTLLHETNSALVAIMFSGFWAGALYHIYFRRRLLAAIGLIVVGMVGIALLGDFMTMPLPH